MRFKYVEWLEVLLLGVTDVLMIVFMAAVTLGYSPSILLVGFIMAFLATGFSLLLVLYR